MLLPFFQANTKLEAMIPSPTAIAKSANIVTMVTSIITNASLFGIFLIILKLNHSKVDITTINIIPVNTAIGIASINLYPNSINDNKNNAADIPDSLLRPPFSTLIILCPIIAQPPIPPNKPVTVLAIPCPIHSLSVDPLVSVRSSIKRKVINDSINPTDAKINA